MGVSNWNTSRRTSKVGTKDVCEIKVAELDSIIKILSAVGEHLTAKKAFSDKALALALLRRANRDEHGNRAPWTDAECALAEEIRAQFMPASLAYGETLANTSRVSKAIPSEAMGSTTSTMEPLEIRSASSASGKQIHECPATSQEAEDMIRSFAKAESWDKEPSEEAAHA
jgi:hypothetical protein